MSARGSSTRLIGSSTSSYAGQQFASPSADCSCGGGIRSAEIANARSDAAVCSPTAATLTPANALASSPYSSNFSLIALTALAEVKATHWYRPVTRPRTARSICCGVRGGSTAIVGTCSGTAPYDLSCSQTPAACSFVLGTSTRQPNSGLVSNQESVRCILTPSPTTAIARPCAVSRLSPAALRSAVMVPSVLTTVCWSVVVPFQVMANGVVSDQPPAISILAMSPIPVSAPSITSVPGAADILLTSEAWMMRTSVAASWVSGMPAYAGTAVAAEIPGTISNGTLALAQLATSAAAPQNMKGSPLNSRSTNCPCLAALMSWRES